MPLGVIRGAAVIRLQRLLYMAAVDRAVFFAILGRVTQLVVAPVTLVLVASHLTPTAQGFYFTFGSLLAAQSFFELGLSLVLVNFASHEWARLSLGSDGRVKGDQTAISKLAELGRLTSKWFGVGSVLFALIVGSVGFWWLAHSPTDVEWLMPWLLLVALTAIGFWTLPRDAILEGCNQVAVLHQFRCWQSLLGNMVCWIALLMGADLWTLPIWAAVNLLRSLLLHGVRYRRFWEGFRDPLIRSDLNWRRDIWPMQWRVGLSGLVSFFALSLFTPVIFHYYGPVRAGQMGMTWTIVGGVQSICLMWIYARVPQFGALVSQREFRKLDELWRRASISSLIITVGASVSCWIGIYAIDNLGLPFAERLLPPLPTLLFFIGIICAQLAHCFVVYLRAHKKEPIMVASVTTSLLTGILVWLFGRDYGPDGVAFAYLCVMALGILPWMATIWRRCRAQWHPV